VPLPVTFSGAVAAAATAAAALRATGAASAPVPPTLPQPRVASRTPLAAGATRRAEAAHFRAAFDAARRNLAEFPGGEGSGRAAPQQLQQRAPQQQEQRGTVRVTSFSVRAPASAGGAVLRESSAAQLRRAEVVAARADELAGAARAPAPAPRGAEGGGSAPAFAVPAWLARVNGEAAGAAVQGAGGAGEGGSGERHYGPL